MLDHFRWRWQTFLRQNCKKKTWYPLNLQPVMFYPWDSPEECSMMSSQITVWAPWIAALRDAHTAASSGLASCSFMVSDSSCPVCDFLLTLPSLLSASLSFPLTFLNSGLLQQGGIMETGCVVAAVIENAASGPQGEPGSSDVLEGWAPFFLPFASCQLIWDMKSREFWVAFVCVHCMWTLMWAFVRVFAFEILSELNRNSVEAKTWPSYQHKLSFFSRFTRCRFHFIPHIFSLSGCFVVPQWTQKLHSVSVSEVR